MRSDNARRPLCAVLPALIALFFCVGSSAAEAAMGPRTGWDLAIEGRHEQAKDFFVARLADEPSDLPSALGLAALLDMENEREASFEVLARALAAETNTPLAAGIVARLTIEARLAPDGGAAALAVLERIAKGEARVQDPEVVAIASEAVAEILARLGRKQEALDFLVRPIGRVRKWRLDGPHDRFSQRGLAELARRPLENLPSFEGKALQTIVGEPTRDGLPRLDMLTVFADGKVMIPDQFRRHGAVRAGVDLVAEEAATIRLRLATPVSFHWSLDGRTILQGLRVHQRLAIAHTALISLDPGRHRLQIALALDSASPAFHLSATLVEGKMPTFEWPTARASSSTATILLEESTLDLALLEDAPADALTLDDPAAVLAADAWLTLRGLDHRRAPLLEAAHRRWPSCTPITLALADYFREADTGAAPEEDLAAARSLYRQVLEEHPAAVRAALRLAEMDHAGGRTDEAWGATRKILEGRPRDADAALLAHTIARRRSWWPEAQRVIERARLHSPLRGDLLSWAIAHARRSGTPERLEALLLEQNRRLFYDMEWPRYLARRGRIDEALEAWDRLIAVRPSTLDYWREKVRLLIDQRRLQQARDVLDAAEKIFPLEEWIPFEKAGIAFSGENDRQRAELTARRQLERSLELNPAHMLIRDALHHLGATDHVARWLVDPLEVIASTANPNPGTDSALLADIAVVFIDPQGGQTEVYQGIHGVYTRQGVEHEGQLTIFPGALIQRIRIFKPDGRVVDVIPSSRAPVNLPGLEPGDAFEYLWYRYIPPSRIVPGSLDGRSVFIFQGNDRDYALSRYVVVHPAEMEVNVCGVERELAVTDTIESGMRVRSWTAREMPQQVTEPHVPNRIEVTPHIRLGYNVTWSDLGIAFREAIEKNLRLDPPLTEWVGEIRTRAAEADSNESESRRLARALHALVNEKMDPGPGAFNLGLPASMSASQGEGNRTTVALALARALGLSPELVVARAIEFRGRELECPDLGQFSYALVAVETDEGRVMLDYNGADHPFDVIPMRISRSDGLFVPFFGDRSPGVRILPERVSEILEESSADLYLDAAGRISGRLRFVQRSAAAAVSRQILASTPANQIEKIHRFIVDSRYPGAEIVHAQMRGAEAEEGELVFEFEIRNARAGRRTSNGIAIPIVTAPIGLFGEYASLRSRVFPLLLDAPIFKRDHVSVTLPDGFHVEALPDVVTQRTEFGRYSLSATRKDRTIDIVRETRIPPQRVETDAYETFRNFTRGIDEAERREILVTPPP